MYRPASICSQAATSTSGLATGVSGVEGVSGPCQTSSCHRLNFDLPAFGCGHPCSVRVLPHEEARRRSVGNENHTRWDFALDALEGDLTVLGADAHVSALGDPDLFHVVGIHV